MSASLVRVVEMVKCPKCEVENTLDSKFCKSCAEPITEAMVQSVVDEMDVLAAEGLKAFNDHRTGEAKLIAETVLKPFPSHAAALSLLSMCLEREGRLAEALDVSERLVELNPNSALDRVKVQHLRQMITEKALDAPEPKRGNGLVAGLAAAALVICGGAALAMAVKPGNNLGSDTVAKNSPNPNTSWQPGSIGDSGTGSGATSSSSGTETPDSKMQVQSGSQVSPPVGNDPNRVQAIQTPASNGTGNQGRPNQGRITNPAGLGGTLPSAYEDGGAPPVKIEGPINLNPTETNAANTKPNPAGNQKPNPSEQDDPAPAIKKPDTGMVNIEVNGNTTAEKPDPKRGESLIQVANQHFLMKKYAEAASTYEKLVSAGGGTASVYQRMAQCYEHLGRRPDAVSAYQRAIQMLESRGSKISAREQTMLDSCRQALKLLQG